MTSKSFMIGPIPEGMRKDVKPYAIAENAFEQLTNAYQFRGRIVRRQGYTLLGRLNTATNLPVMGLKTRELFGLGLQQLIAFDTVQAYEYNTGSLSFVPLPSVMPTVWTGADYQFFNIANYAGAFWATNFVPGMHGAAILLITNAVIGVGTPLVTTILPHGFSTGQTVVFINVQGMTEINGLSSVITVLSPTTFSLDQIDTSTFGIFGGGGFALNSVVSVTGQDGIRYYGELTDGTGWANYNPPIDPENALLGALLIFPYRGYLVFLNTWEGNEASGPINYGNRARWTQIGTPYYSEPVPTIPSQQFVDVKAARDDLFGRGGANDAPTQEVIIGAAFIRDLLVVYFERSTWRLRFVNNAQNPFVWERVNVELGSSCTFSTIPFDKGVQALGNRGILISDGNDTVRFDEKIPDDVFNIRQSQNGLNRVYGIRTFRTRLSYWTFPDAERTSGKFPDKVLIYNYETQNWSYFDDCFTCFGYFYPSTADLGDRWIDLDEPWPEYNDKNCDVGTLHSGLETVIAGNQQGFVFKLEQSSSQNSASLFIQSIALDPVNLINSPFNNLPDGTWIKITDILGTTSSDGVSLNGRNFKISSTNLDDNNFSLNEWEPIEGGNAVGASYTYTVNYVPILKGSIQIDVGTLVFRDSALDGILSTSIPGTFGTINYRTGVLSLTFNPVLGAPTAVNIRVVSVDSEQILVPVNLIGAYGGEGLISKLSNIEILTKIFNFMNEDAGTRLSKIDFYMNLTNNGEFTCSALGDSSNIPMNVPLRDNLQSNVVLTSKNPYQVGSGDETIYRLFIDTVSQTVQLQLNMNDRQMAVDAINDEDIELLAMMITIRDKGRLI